jgi:hypothetical protein
MSSPKRVFLVFLAFAVGFAFVPFKSLNCPAWDTWIVDEHGNPVPGITVRLSYQNYSVEKVGHEIDRTTDKNGHASFTAQTLGASLARRCVSMVLAARQGVHSSFGPHASVLAFGKGLEGVDVDLNRNVVVDWTGQPRAMESRIVVKPSLFLQRWTKNP